MESQHNIFERLDFTLPDFIRISWVSEKARQVWEPRLESINRAWFDIEWRSVLAGVRSCALTRVSPSGLPSLVSRWVSEGLSVLPLQIEGTSDLAYAVKARRVEDGKPIVLCAVVGSRESVQHFSASWYARDDEAIGTLLGYPGCCREFFKKAWSEQHYIDTTWPMATNTLDGVEEGMMLNVSGRPEANILWRWMGVRAVPHLPCRFDCSATIELGDKLLSVGIQAGYGSEVNLIREILSWSIEWSALHGIAEIKTPVLKVSTRTDATAKRYVVRWKGAGRPLESVSGLNFPYDSPSHALVTDSAGFRRGIRHIVEIHMPHPDWYHMDNGFSSWHAMDSCHAPIVALAKRELNGLSGSVLDLGCGNGVLLKKICSNNQLVPYGVDIRESCLDHARELLPGFSENFIDGDFFDSWIWSSRKYVLGIVMIGRLLEVDRNRAEALVAELRTHCERVLAYVYEGWSQKSFRDLLQQAGLRTRESGIDGDNVGLLAFAQ